MTGDEIVDDDAGHRLVIRVGGAEAEAELVYERDDDRLLVLHTGVPEVFRGRGTGGRLVAAAVEKARREGLTVVPWCSFARRWLHEHPDRAEGLTVDREPPVE